MRLPTIGLSSPPSAPGGGVISVNTASDSPENPCQNSVAQDQPPANRGRAAVAPTERPIMIALRRRRAA